METNSEKNWRRLRQERDTRLIDSDFTQLVDFQAALTEAEKNQWVSYRQQLRDLPDQISDPENVVWPARPDGR